MSNKTTRNIVSFFELSDEWQREAISNLDDQAEDASYLEPMDGQTPDKNPLYDLTECMRVDGEEYHGVIGISNNTALAVKLSDDGTQAEVWYI